MSAVEKKGWFIFLVAMLTTLCIRYLMDSVGMPPTMSGYGLAQWIVYILCYAALWRGISFLGWLLVLAVAPGLADPKLRKPA